MAGDWWAENAGDILERYGVAGGGIAGGQPSGGVAMDASGFQQNSGSGWGGWNTGNVFDSWDLNPLAAQTGMERDALSTQRDAFLQPLFDRYRSAMGEAGSADDDATLFHDVNFRNYAATGALPTMSGGDFSAWQGGGNYQAPDPFTGKAPAPIAAFGEKFAAPTMEQATESPGFKFRLGESMKALERKASAGGTLNMPGTAKALAAYAGDMASSEYDKVYGRALGEYKDKFGVHQWNEGNRYNSERTNRMDDRSMWESDRNFGRGVFESDRNFGRGAFESDRAFGEGRRMNDFGIWHTQDSDQWNRNMGLADMGLRAAGGAGAAGSNYANSASDLITGAGNAQAAGRVAGGNAWAGAFGDIANNGMGAYLEWMRRRRMA